jgi:hypothetical protein
MVLLAANRILRQTVEFTTVVSDALGFRREAERFCSDELVPAIERLIDSLDIPTGRLVQINRVEIHAVRAGSALDEQLLEQILRELRRELEAHISSGQVAGKEPVGYSVIEQLLVFLDRGYLPWNAAPAEEWNAAVEEALHGVDSSQLGRIAAILSLERARFRFAACQSWTSLVRVLQKLTSSEAAIAVVRIATEAHQLADRISERGVSRGFELPLARIVLNQLFGQNAVAPGSFAEQVASVLRSRQDLAELVAAERTFKPTEYSHLNPLLTSTAASSPRLEQQAPAKRAEAMIETGKEVTACRVSDLAPPPSPDNAAHPLYIEDAGLVIVAPYLPAFFRKLNLIEAGKISDPVTALSLLHFLTFATLPQHEAQLVLPKILCGMPLETPADLATALSEEQLREADELLGAVIANWPILKSTSVEGLRDTFLRREGALELRNAEWSLRIQRTGVDVLLDHLRWTISLIRLPWMPNPLRTDWA